MSVLLFIVLILVVLWVLGGFVVPVGTGLIHLLLLVALIVLIYDLFSRRRNL